MGQLNAVILVTHGRGRPPPSGPFGCRHGLVDPHDWRVVFGLLAPHRSREVIAWLVDTLADARPLALARRDDAMLTDLPASLTAMGLQSWPHSSASCPNPAGSRASEYSPTLPCLRRSATPTFATPSALTRLWPRASPGMSPARPLTGTGTPRYPGSPAGYPLHLRPTTACLPSSWPAGRHAGQGFVGSAAEREAEVRRAVSPFLAHPYRRVRAWDADEA